MNKNIIIIGISVVIISLLIYFIKNYNTIESFIKKINKNKKVKIIKSIIYILIIVWGIYFKSISNIYINIDRLKAVKENEIMFEEADKKIEEEKKFYKNSIKQEFENANSESPYIPEGFSFVEGEWNNGFVIQDEFQNQYVWVPCTNKDNSNIEMLSKREFDPQVFVGIENCYDEEYEEFLKSALENGGFYVSRYEIGKENDKPVSKPNVEIWSGITRNDAQEISKKMYTNGNLKSSLINSYAYDTTLAWLEKTNEIEAYKYDMSKDEKIFTGRNKYNNIFDFTDNIMEYSLETNYDTVIIRGFAYSEEIEDRSRYAILKDDNYFDNVSIISFRTILYK